MKFLNENNDSYFYTNEGKDGGVESITLVIDNGEAEIMLTKEDIKSMLEVFPLSDAEKDYQRIILDGLRSWYR